MPTGRVYPGVVKASDGKNYVIGGHDGINYSNAVEAYDPSNDIWTSLSSMPTRRYTLGVAATNNGKIYAIGGHNGNKLDTVEVYDIVSNTWTSAASMPTPRAGLVAVTGSNGKIYAIGGAPLNDAPIANNEEYDPSTNLWTTKAPMPAAKTYFAAVNASNGRIYAIGGRPSTDSTLTTSTVVSYDSNTDIWLNEASMPTPRQHFAAATIGSKIYALGGYNQINNILSVLPTVEEATIVPDNLPPTVDAGGPYYVDEGETLQVTAIGNDPETGPLTYKWDLDNNGSFETSGQFVTFSASGLDGPSNKTVAVQVTDNGNLTATDSAAVIVNNVAPVVGTITAPMIPVQVNTVVNTNASFTDEGVPDTHTAVWDWQDGTSIGVVTESNGSGTITGSHTYTTAGVYTVSLTVTDDDLASGTNQFMYVVVYDPAGGFVTGAGRYNAPAGSIPAAPTESGMTNFRTNAKYVNNVLKGSTRLNFRDGDFVFNFDSTSHDWLVVTNGNLAQLRGTGTVNGLGNYTFQLTALDSTTDTIRIKIWDTTTSVVVYDNQIGALDNATPTTPLTNGNINIHN